jgi:hypothetical protein
MVSMAQGVRIKQKLSNEIKVTAVPLELLLEELWMD